MQPMARGRFNLHRLASSCLERHNSEEEEVENEEDQYVEDVKDMEDKMVGDVQVETEYIAAMEEVKAEDEVNMKEEAVTEAMNEEPMVEVAAVGDDKADSDDNEADNDDDCAILALVRELVNELTDYVSTLICIVMYVNHVCRRSTKV